MADAQAGFLVDSPLTGFWVTHGVALGIGGLGGVILSGFRNRVRKLTYRVVHEHLALSGNDPHFGNVQVTLQGKPVTNLYTSTVTLENGTGVDFQNLKFRVYTSSETLLMGQFTSLPGTASIIPHTDEYIKLLQVPEGQSATPAQWEAYNHRRDYIIAVFNRGQTAVIRFLTTVSQGGSAVVFVDVMHPGVSIKYLPSVPEIWGVPIGHTGKIGFALCILAYVISGFFLSPWIGALVCLAVGGSARLLGAGIYRLMTALFRFI